MLYFIWVIIVILLICGYLFSKTTLGYLALSIYIIVILIKGCTKIANYMDEEKKNHKDEKSEINEIAKEMARKGMTFGGIRAEKEIKCKDKFEYQRKLTKRKLYDNLVELLLLK